MSNKVIVVGGGAAGMMAAVVASRNGSQVTLLERNDRVGKKLLATGNGRCNYTNLNASIANYHGKNRKFAQEALSELNVDKTIDFFEDLGITPAYEDGGKVYPLSFQSSSMLDVFRFELENRNIDLITEAFVSEIRKRDKFTVKLKDDRSFQADRVIVATGGMAMPVSGSDGNGYSLVKKLGHSVTETFPGLVQLKLEGNIFKQIAGVKFVGKVGVYHKNSLLVEDYGDVLFTDYGISGPPVLQISRRAIDYMNKGLDVELRVAIIHNKSSKEIQEYFINRFRKMSDKTIQQGLIGFVNKKLILPILKSLNIDKNTLAKDLNMKEIESLAKLFTSWSFKVTGNKGWGQAQVTAGGVDTKGLDSKTMESKLIDGLYIVGELLDIDGDCGGFNLQWAWSSGYLAGINVSR